jgi:ankyrin repeat protein
MLAEGVSQITEVDNDGNTALLMAAFNGHLAMLQ